MVQRKPSCLDVKSSLPGLAWWYLQHHSPAGSSSSCEAGMLQVSPAKHPASPSKPLIYESSDSVPPCIPSAEFCDFPATSVFAPPNKVDARASREIEISGVIAFVYIWNGSSLIIRTVSSIKLLDCNGSRDTSTSMTEMLLIAFAKLVEMHIKFSARGGGCSWSLSPSGVAKSTDGIGHLTFPHLRVTTALPI